MPLFVFLTGSVLHKFTIKKEHFSLQIFVKNFKNIFMLNFNFNADVLKEMFAHSEVPV